LDLADFRRNARAPECGVFGSAQVRYGKASRGSPPKRRTVLTVPELGWVVDLLREWVEEIRPLLAPGHHPALWITERRGRVSVRHLNDAFAAAREEAELPVELDLHSLRHSYVTHLLEFGYPPLMVQQQVGHAYQSTTALYTSVSDEFRNRLLEQALHGHPEVMGGRTVKREMSYAWHLRARMAEQGLFQTSELVPLLAERGVHLSREQVYRLVTQPPQRLSLDTLAALCDILEVTPNDLIEITATSA
jgi:DNA-binding Xre family transcriptional regulator